MGVVLDERKDSSGAGSQLSLRKRVPFFSVILLHARKVVARSTADNGSSSLLLVRSCSMQKVEGRFTFAEPGISGRTEAKGQPGTNGLFVVSRCSHSEYHPIEKSSRRYSLCCM